MLHYYLLIFIYNFYSVLNCQPFSQISANTVLKPVGKSSLIGNGFKVARVARASSDFACHLPLFTCRICLVPISGSDILIKPFVAASVRGPVQATRIIRVSCVVDPSWNCAISL